MAVFRFNLRQLLLTIVVLALVLLLARYSVRSTAVAVALLSVGIAGVLILASSLLLYGFLRGVGALSADKPPASPAPASPPDGSDGPPVASA